MENISGLLFALQLRGANVSVFLQISSRTNLKLSFGGIHQTLVQFRQYLQSKRFHPTFQRPDFNILIFSPLNLQSSSIRDGDHGECPVPLLVPPTTVSYAFWMVSESLIFDHQVYDWLALFDREVEHIWSKEWNIAKILYLLSRYGPFIDVPINLVCTSGLTLVYHWDGGNVDRISGHPRSVYLSIWGVGLRGEFQYGEPLLRPDEVRRIRHVVLSTKSPSVSEKSAFVSPSIPN